MRLDKNYFKPGKDFGDLFTPGEKARIEEIQARKIDVNNLPDDLEQESEEDATLERLVHRGVFL